MSRGGLWSEGQTDINLQSVPDITMFRKSIDPHSANVMAKVQGEKVLSYSTRIASGQKTINIKCDFCPFVYNFLDGFCPAENVCGVCKRCGAATCTQCCWHMCMRCGTKRHPFWNFTGKDQHIKRRTEIQTRYEEIRGLSLIECDKCRHNLSFDNVDQINVKLKYCSHCDELLCTNCRGSGNCCSKCKKPIGRFKSYIQKHQRWPRKFKFNRVNFALIPQSEQFPYDWD